jgi:hypothetical protein
VAGATGASASRPKRGYKKLQLLLETEEECFVDYLPQATSEVGDAIAVRRRESGQNEERVSNRERERERERESNREREQQRERPKDV